MSGLRKAKQYDWKDSNLALFGSDVEKNIKKASAETEEAWQGSGQEPGLRIWRVVKFQIKDWPKEDYGNFFDGDSYIILNTYKPDPDSEKLAYDVHFWIGKYSSQDEYGTAAYKTVELDHFLNDEPVQHREVMNHESALFKTYFDSVTLLKGGADSGFKHVEPEKYTSRLLRYKRVGRRVQVKELPLKRSSLNSDDVFILDKGLDIYQLNGSGANKDEKFQAMQYCQQLESDRNGKAKAETFEEGAISEEHDFYKSLTGEDDDDDDDIEGDYSQRPKKLFRLSDADGSLDMELVSEGTIDRSSLDSNDAFIVDAGNSVIVWIGSGASKSEKRKGLEYATRYLMDADAKLLPISVVGENQICKELDDAFINA